MIKKYYVEKLSEEQIRSNICKKIRASGIPIPTLAKEAELPCLVIYKVLNAHVTPSLKTAIKLSKALNISLDELLGISKQQSKSHSIQPNNR